MDKFIVDDMKKESRMGCPLMIISYILAVLTLVYNYHTKEYSNKEMLIIFLVFLFLGAYSMYVWLYGINYRVEFNNEKVYLRTLFRRIEFSICDVRKYTCKKYKKSVFYQFNLITKDRKVLINTRYKDEFEKVLKNNNVEQVAK